MSSPDNYYTTRTVFETPLFTEAECAYLVDMAERVADVNYRQAQQERARLVLETAASTEDVVKEMLGQPLKGYLEDPPGWQKLRHRSFPTTDLNLVTDPFTREDQEWVRTKLDARLAPTLERIFGVPPSSIRAIDVSN
jgi:hypothetical protein